MGKTSKVKGSKNFRKMSMKSRKFLRKERKPKKTREQEIDKRLPGSPENIYIHLKQSYQSIVEESRESEVETRAFRGKPGITIENKRLSGKPGNVMDSGKNQEKNERFKEKIRKISKKRTDWKSGKSKTN